MYLNEEKLWNAFKYFDVDNSNEITVDNLIEAMAREGKKILRPWSAAWGLDLLFRKWRDSWRRDLSPRSSCEKALDEA